MSHMIAGIDVHKKVLVVAVADATIEKLKFVGRRFGTSAGDLQQLADWLSQQHHFRIDCPVDFHSRMGRLAPWAILGMVAATLALAGLFVWRLFG